MKKTITISLEDFKMLREHLNQAIKILNSLEVDGSVKAPKLYPKETKAQKIEKYINLIESGKRGTKPDHLKK